MDFEASTAWDPVTRPVAFPVEMSPILFTDRKLKSGIIYYPKAVVYINLSTASKELQSSRALLNSENPSWIELLKELQLTLRTA